MDITKGKNSGYSKSTCTSMYIAVVFTIAETWKQPSAPELMIGSRKCSIYTQWNFTKPQGIMKFFHLQVNGWNWRTSS
jgi:hypothetical protein